MKNLIKIFSSAALIFGLYACGENDKTAGGTSEEAEGIIAIVNKTIAGVSQKGPFMKGSKITLRETKSDGTLIPTGKEYETKSLSDKGDFKFENLELESQYALLSAEGYYKSEETGEKSDCSIQLYAISDLEKREKANINMLTHIEYKRVIELVKSGKNFKEAKKQASREILQNFGININAYSAEDLDVLNTSDADLVLFNISLYVDRLTKFDYYDEPTEEECESVQTRLDNYANDLADDGVISDSLMGVFIYLAYEGQLRNEEDLTERDIEEKEKIEEGSRLDLNILKNEYEFGKRLFTYYMDIEPCTDSLWGVYVPKTKPIYYEHPQYNMNNELIDTLEGDYLICNAYFWELKTTKEINSYTTPIKHQNSSMTDPRDGKKYKTIIFEHKGKKYEWMAEDLKYTDSTVKFADEKHPGSYSWTTAMNLDKKYMTESIDSSIIDTLHQGICPDGWHISSSAEWTNLIRHVEGARNLLDEQWQNHDRKVALAKDAFGVFFNISDFHLTPMDSKYLETSYHTYSYDESILSYISLKEVPSDFESYDNYYDAIEFGGTAINFFVMSNSTYNNFRFDRYEKGYVRCVKN